jgi:hypothetical protein
VRGAWLLALGLLACSQDELKQQANAAYQGSAEVAHKAASAAGEAAQAAADKTASAANQLAAALPQDPAQSVKDAASSVAKQLAGLDALRAEVAKVYSNEHDLDFLVEPIDSEAQRAFEAKLAAMPSLEVSGLKVGYEEQNTLSLHGKSYSSSFRASWLYQGQKISLAYYSQEKFDAKAFAALLERLVPVAQRYLAP